MGLFDRHRIDSVESGSLGALPALFPDCTSLHSGYVLFLSQGVSTLRANIPASFIDNEIENHYHLAL
jgi:hypothetical protein